MTQLKPKQTLKLTISNFHRLKLERTLEFTISNFHRMFCSCTIMLIQRTTPMKIWELSTNQKSFLSLLERYFPCKSWYRIVFSGTLHTAQQRGKSEIHVPAFTCIYLIGQNYNKTNKLWQFDLKLNVKLAEEQKIYKRTYIKHWGWGTMPSL